VNKRPLAVLAIFFIIGIVLARFLPDSVKLLHVFVVGLILIGISFILPRNDNVGKIANLLLLLSVTSFAVLLYINSNTFSNNHISHFLGEEKLKTSVVGIIKSPSLIRKPYYGKISSTYLFEIEGLKEDNEWLGVKGLAQVRIQTEKDYGYGDKLLVKGTIKRPRNDAGKFDYREYLEKQNIFALVNTKENNVSVLARDYKSNPILGYIYFIREKLKNQFIEKMPLETGAFLRAILLGDRSELTKDIQDSFKNSGTMHVMAISGLHVGLIALSVLFLLRFLRIKREICYTLTILFLISFAFLTLSRPSVLRAVVMACIFLIGMLLGRRVDVYNTMGAAALFILIRNPKDLFNVGFQLSFLAVFFIISLVPRFMRLIREGTNPSVKRFLYAPLAVSVAAWLGTSPLILYYFKIVTPVAIIANLFIIPVLFVLLIGGLGFLLLGWTPFLGPLLADFNNLFAFVIFSLADFFASLRFGHFYI